MSAGEGLLHHDSDRENVGQDLGRNIIRRLAFGKKLIVGVGDRGRRAASRDGGKSWQDAPDSRAIDTLADVAFGGERFVGVGLNGLRMSSHDGITWSTPQRGDEGEHLNSIVWNGEHFVAVGAGATYFSSDGEQWERQPNADAPLTVAYGGGVFVGLHWQGRIFLSTDALRWRQVFKGERHFEAVCFGV